MFYDQFCKSIPVGSVGFKGRLYPNYKADAYAPWRDEKCSPLQSARYRTSRNSLQHDGIYQIDWPLTRDALCLPSLILWRALSRELIFRNAMPAFRSTLNAYDWQFFKRSSHLAKPRWWLYVLPDLRRNYAPFSTVFRWRLTEIFRRSIDVNFFF